MAQDKQSDASEPVRDDTGNRAESLTPRDRSATLQEKSEAEKGNNKESLSDMELKALSPDNPRASELAANRFEIVDDSGERSSGDREKTVTVKSGDTLWGIVNTHLGGRASGTDIKAMVDTVARDNKLFSPDLIYPGQVLTLPELSEKEDSEAGLNLPEARPRHEKLLAIADRQGIASEEFKHDLELVEQRVDSDLITAIEAEQAFKHVERLLTTESDAGLTRGDRQILAQQIVAQMADPTRTDQGQFNTCNVTTVECRLYSRHPSMPARMVTDLALTGEYMAGDGTKVRIDVDAKDERSKSVAVPDGGRSYASQLFQVCAVNVHYVREGQGTTYVQENAGIEGFNDNGERLYGRDGKILERAPDLLPEEIVEVHNAITGEPHDQNFFIGSFTGSGVCTVNSTADLDRVLRNASDSHNFPVIIEVHTSGQPFWNDSGCGSAGGAGGDSGGWHVVTITGFEPGPPGVATVDNQWGRSADHDDMIMPVETRDLFRASLDPEDAVKELRKEVKERRDSGSPDAGMEFDLLRLRKLTKDIGNADYDKELKALVKEHKTRWLDERETGSVEFAEEFRGITTLPTALNLMSPGDDKLLFLSELEGDKLISHKDMCNYLLSEAITQVKEGKPRSPVFKKLEATLTEKERKKLANDILIWT